MSDQHTFRIRPVFPDEWGEAEYDALSAFPSARDFTLANWQGDDARGTHGTGALLPHPALAKAFLTFNNHVATGSTLSKRIRELLILRIGWLRCSEYEFMQHVVLGRRAGLSDEEIDRITRGPDAQGWDPVDAALLRATDELCRDAFIQDDTWAVLAEHFTEQQLLDLITAVGCYEVAAMIFKTLKLPMECGVPRMDPETRARMYAQQGNVNA
ncbi:MAG TPA: carboxymuconolactone decarboxylase family protein [Porticoccaceae bacterium]